MTSIARARARTESCKFRMTENFKSEILFQEGFLLSEIIIFMTLMCEAWKLFCVYSEHQCVHSHIAIIHLPW